jgi:hypothetical protein
MSDIQETRGTLTAEFGANTRSGCDAGEIGRDRLNELGAG